MIEQIEQKWLKSFHCVYENQSFKRAAEFLNLPTSNVSRHIALLEERLSIRLFERTTRRIMATEAGEQLYLSTQPLLEKLNSALEEVTQHSHQVMGQLKVLMPDSPALAQAMVAFCQKHPSISLSCETSLSPKEDLLDGFDVVLSFHRGQLPDSSWIAREIKRWQSSVFAAPELLQNHSTPYKLTDLSYVPCISTLTAMNGAPWIFKTPDGHTVTQKVQSTFKVNSGYLAKSGAIAELGLAILPIDSCTDEVNSGALEVVHLEYQPADLVLYAFYASRKHTAKKILTLIEHLQHQSKP